MHPPRLQPFAPVLLALAASCGGGLEPLTEARGERAAVEVLVTLERAGIPASRERARGREPRWTIEVDESDLARARALLERLDLPREPRPSFAERLDAGGLIPSPAEERARLLHATAEELARTLEAHERVLSAHVHVARPGGGPLDGLLAPSAADPNEGASGDSAGAGSARANARPTASVLIRFLPAAHATAASSRAGAGSDAAPGQNAVEAAERARFAAPEVGSSIREHAFEDEDRAGSPGAESASTARDSSGFHETLERPFTPADVRTLVANAIDGLSPDDVAVVFSRVDLGALLAEVRDLRTPRHSRTAQLAVALGVATLVLCGLVSRERRRNASLRAELERRAES